jgi:hypothetical protein
MRWRLILVAGLVPTCWLGMMLVHECGHMLAAVITGGTVARLEFPLWGFSRTDVSPDPHPLLVTWAGPLAGVALPLLNALIWRTARRPSILAGIFSGFCLLANGAYLGAGSLAQVGDTAEILKHAGTLWTLRVVGLFLMTAGLVQWYLLGPALGIPRTGKPQALFATTLGAVLLIAAGLWQFTAR